MRRLTGITVALFLTLTLAYLVAAAHGWSKDTLWADRLARTQEGGAHSWPTGAMVAAILASDLVLPIPSSVIMALAGSLLGTLRGGLWAFAGAMSSALLGFGLCRHLGRPVFSRLVGREETARVRRFLDRYGVWAVILSRSVPMLTEVVSCMAGLGGMSFRRFVLCSTAGTLPLCLLYAWAGASGTDPAGMGWAIVLAFALPAAGLGLIRLAERRPGARHESESTR
jgi:uncharacterized membrane protein YdjX (TVP38/TMEM64 family)